MKLREQTLRRLVRQEIIREQQLNEGLTDAVAKIRNLAIKIAKQNFDKAIPHIKTQNITPKMKFDGNKAMSIATKTLSQTKLNEDLRANINKFSEKIFMGAAVASALTGLTALQAWARVLDSSFYRWYYSTIQKMTEPQVMDVMQDIVGATEAEAALWGKWALYAFFIFFTITIISLAVKRLSRDPNRISRRRR